MSLRRLECFPRVERDKRKVTVIVLVTKDADSADALSVEMCERSEKRAKLRKCEQRNFSLVVQTVVQVAFGTVIVDGLSI
jgi:hypothetical protein